jgi:hypothetical protein
MSNCCHQSYRDPLGHRALARIGFEINHLLKEVRRGKTSQTRIFWTAGSIGPMTVAAREHIGFSAVGDDVWHLIVCRTGTAEPVALPKRQTAAQPSNKRSVMLDTQRLR